MTKEQFFTFKSDMKAGMRIIKLRNTHRKAYWNDGFETQEAQDEAVKKVREEIESLKSTIVNRIPEKKWDNSVRKWVETKDTIEVVLGGNVYEHWAYYCAKHRLDENQSIEYIQAQMNNLKEQTKNTYFAYTSVSAIWEKYVKPTLDKYETIVCVK